MTAVIVLFSAAVLTVLYLLEQSSEKKAAFPGMELSRKKGRGFSGTVPGGYARRMAVMVQGPGR